MTEGQWLVEYFWNNSELLAACNKWGGVAMAFIGACIVAPAAVQHKLQPAKRAIRAVKTSVLKVIGRSKPTHISVRVGDVLLTGEGGLSSKLDVPWNEAFTAEEGILWLRGELLRVKDSLVKETEELKRADGQIRDQLSSLEQRTFPEIEKLQAELTRQQAESLRIDSAGLPPIVAGIILTGVPDELSTTGAFGWITCGIAAWVTWRAILHSKRSGVWKTSR